MKKYIHSDTQLFCFFVTKIITFCQFKLFVTNIFVLLYVIHGKISVGSEVDSIPIPVQQQVIDPITVSTLKFRDNLTLYKNSH